MLISSECPEDADTLKTTDLAQYVPLCGELKCLQGMMSAVLVALGCPMGKPAKALCGNRVGSLMAMPGPPPPVSSHSAGHDGGLLCPPGH